MRLFMSDVIDRVTLMLNYIILSFLTVSPSLKKRYIEKVFYNI